MQSIASSIKQNHCKQQQHISFLPMRLCAVCEFFFFGFLRTGVINTLMESSRFAIEGVCGIRPQVTFDAMSNSPSHSQLNTRKFGRRIW